MTCLSLYLRCDHVHCEHQDNGNCQHRAAAKRLAMLSAAFLPVLMGQVEGSCLTAIELTMPGVLMSCLQSP